MVVESAVLVKSKTKSLVEFLFLVHSYNHTLFTGVKSVFLDKDGNTINLDPDDEEIILAEFNKITDKLSEAPGTIMMSDIIGTLQRTLVDIHNDNMQLHSIKALDDQDMPTVEHQCMEFTKTMDLTYRYVFVPIDELNNNNAGGGEFQHKVKRLHQKTYCRECGEVKWLMIPLIKEGEE